MTRETLENATSQRKPQVNLSVERVSQGSKEKSQVDIHEPGLTELGFIPSLKCLSDCISSQCVIEMVLIHRFVKIRIKL